MSQLFKAIKLNKQVTRSLTISNNVFNTIESSVPLTNVKGLSSQVIRDGVKPILKGTSKEGPYKNPEYFCYVKTSYFDAELEMANFRCPQPSAKKQN